MTAPPDVSPTICALKRRAVAALGMHNGSRGITLLFRDDRAFSPGAITWQQKALDLMSAELFGSSGQMDAPVFELVQCSQGEQALRAAEDADAQRNSCFRKLALEVTRMVCEIRGASEGRVENISSQKDRRQRRSAPGLSSLA